MAPALPTVPQVQTGPRPQAGPLPSQAGPPPPPAAVTANPPPATPDCLSQLAAAHVAAERVTVGPLPDPRCTVADAVRVTGLSLPDGSAVALPDRPVIACVTAATFASYVRDLLAPLAKGSYGPPLDTVWTGPGLECRSRDNIPGAKLSAHGEGLAVDVAQVRLADKRLIEVGRPKADGDRAFESAALAGGCGYFHTALGPGADAFHETHWHFDLLPRGAKGEAKLCQGQ